MDFATLTHRLNSTIRDVNTIVSALIETTSGEHIIEITRVQEGHQMPNQELECINRIHTLLPMIGRVCSSLNMILAETLFLLTRVDQRLSVNGQMNNTGHEHARQNPPPPLELPLPVNEQRGIQTESERWDAIITEVFSTRFVLTVLLIVGMGCSGTAPYFIFETGDLRPYFCAIGSMGFIILFLLGHLWKGKIIGFLLIPIWSSDVLSLAVGVGSVVVGRFVPVSKELSPTMQRRVIGGFCFVGCSIYCLMQSLHPRVDFGLVLICTLLPMQVTISYFEKSFNMWYVWSGPAMRECKVISRTGPQIYKGPIFYF